ncbi:MAG: hypothetical protein ACK5JM_15545 [Rhodoblastus sp.]
MNFAVECSNYLFADEAAVEEYFESLHEAQAFAEKMSKSYRAIWMSERGVQVGKKRPKWFYFWWSPALWIAAEWGRPGERGQGYPATNLNSKYLVDYVPIDKA